MTCYCCGGTGTVYDTGFGHEENPVAPKIQSTKVLIVQEELRKLTKDSAERTEVIIKRLKTNEMTLCRAVNLMRCNGEGIIADPLKGYYMTSDKDKIKKQVSSLRGRANVLYRAANGLIQNYLMGQEKI